MVILDEITERDRLFQRLLKIRNPIFLQLHYLA